MLQPLHHAQIVVEPCRRLPIAMNLAWIEHQPDRCLVLEFQMPIEFAGLADVDARIVLAVENQKRRLAVRGVKDRTSFELEVPVLPRSLQGMNLVLFVRNIGRAHL